MATLKEVQDELAVLKQHISDESSKVQAKVKDLGDQVQALKDQLAAGTAVTAADLDGVVASIKDLETGVDTIDTPPVVPPAPQA